ncbi:MAG: endonuclease, partial [Bacillota bacterium]|nr:endonuclease [Bacillota bacterium]
MREMLLKIYQLLFDYYKVDKWWPSDDAYEICVGAILTQNTNWENVKKSLANFSVLTPETVISMEDDELQEKIRPSGFY